MGYKMTMAKAERATAHETCRRLLEEWLIRDIRRLLQLPSLCMDSLPRAKSQDDSRFGANGVHS